ISDRWCWSLEGSQEFSVKSSRILIDNTILSKAEVPTRWLRVVPIKVNVHAWRVCLDKLPTRVNLSLRGMDISSIACPLCNSAVESTSHIFFACPLARQVWRNFLIWYLLRDVVVNLALQKSIALWEFSTKEYPAKIHVRSKLHYFSLIKDRLNEAHRLLFRTTCFGHWLDITYVENDDGIIHYVLQKQCCVDDDRFDLPLIYNVNGHNLRFGRREFCLVTGFKFALIEDEEKFSKVSDEDAIRICLLLSLQNTFPWGEHIWRQLYDSIKNVSSKHKLEHLDGLRKNPNHVPSYSLYDFLFDFKIWIIESSCESDRWWTKVPELIPLAVAWTRKAEFFKLQYFGDLFHKAPIELALTKAEFQSNWYTPSCDFFMWYAPRRPPVSIGGLYGEYLNKRSAARATKQKDNREFHPGLRGRQKGREAALIDRVRDLEGLCESLLTLPKEVKSLRGHIFKLESIIYRMSRTSKIVEKDVGDVYCCDIYGNVPGVLMAANPASKPIYGDFSSDLAVLNGFCNLSQNEDER
ncbi:phospholipase-like protein, partial [Tanacetum coccineum]